MKSILTADGYTKNAHGYYAKNGKTISFTIEDPISYSDYYADAQLISSELKAEGIDATVYGVQPSQWYSRLGRWSLHVHHPLGQWRNRPVHPVRQLA